jgi:hypothetical protein
VTMKLSVVTSDEELKGRGVRLVKFSVRFLTYFDPRI